MEQERPENPPPAVALIDADTVAAALGVSRFSIYRWGVAGRTPSVRLGRKVRFELAAVVGRAIAVRPKARDEWSPCISILGGIQPNPLADYVRRAVRGGADDDGLIQRFQVLVSPDVGGSWRDIDRWPDTEARNRVHAIFGRLAERAMQSAALLGAKLRAGKLPSPFRARDVYRQGWSGLSEQEELGAALEVLLDLSWLRQEPVPPDPARGGRPTKGGFCQFCQCLLGRVARAEALRGDCCEITANPPGVHRQNRQKGGFVSFVSACRARWRAHRAGSEVA